jgi:transcriptional regulator with XRE-family HTH domain
MNTKFDQLMQDPEFRKLYAIEALIADVSQLIADLLEQRKLRQADLARILKKTPAFVSQLLNGKSNLTLRTVAEIAFALGVRVAISAENESSSGREVETCGSTQDCHTFRTRLPLQWLPVTFSWERPERAEPTTEGTSFRSEYVA